jgi:hypothetical protein
MKHFTLALVLVFMLGSTSAALADQTAKVNAAVLEQAEISAFGDTDASGGATCQGRQSKLSAMRADESAKAMINIFSPLSSST